MYGRDARYLWIMQNIKLAALTFAPPRAYLRSELLASVSVWSIERAVTAGSWSRILPQIYAPTEAAESFAVRAHAATLWSADARVAGRAALFAWGLIDRPPRTIEVAVPQDFRRRAPDWLRLRRRTRYPEAIELGLLRVVGPVDALLHGFGEGSRRVDEAVYRAVRSGIADAGDVRDAVALAPRVRKRRALIGVLEAAQRGAESYLEALAMADIFRTKEFAGLVFQHDVVVEGALYRLDAFDPVTRTAIECDGGRFHASAAARRRDCRRDAELAAIGIQTVRLTYRDVVDDPAWCRRAVLATMTARASRG